MDTMTLKAGESFDSIMETYMPMVYRIAFTRLGNRADAEDITQDVFVRLFKADVSFESEEHRKAWLIRCTVNRIKSFAASAWFRHRASDAGLENMCEEELSTGVSDATASFTEQSDRSNAVAAAVMKLPPKYRTVIHLFYFEDMSISDISRAISVKESTVKSQLSRAREMLRPMLEEVDF